MKVNDIITTACRYMHIELPDCCYTDVMTTTLADQLQYNPLLTNLLMCLDTVLSEMNSILPNIAVVNIGMSFQILCHL